MMVLTTEALVTDIPKRKKICQAECRAAWDIKMKITCPQCNAQNLIFGIAVSCVVCGSILVGRHDDLPHQNFSNTTYKYI